MEIKMPAAARIGDPFTCGDFIAQGSPDVFVNGIPFARWHDATTGHGCWPPTVIMDHAKTVYANNILVAYVSHLNVPHCCDDDCHSGAIKEASPDTFVENK